LPSVAGSECAATGFHRDAVIRCIAAIDVTGLANQHLWIYDTEEKTWPDLGLEVVHPADWGGNNRWDWMKCSWDPWFADSSHVAFTHGSSIMVSTPDGKSKQNIVGPSGTIGLATPSPDGNLIAYVKFGPVRHEEQPHWTFWGNTTIWVVPAQGGEARQITKQAEESTYCLRWLNTKRSRFRSRTQRAVRKSLPAMESACRLKPTACILAS
jgi:hypothetical protein